MFGDAHVPSEVMIGLPDLRRTIVPLRVTDVLKVMAPEGNHAAARSRASRSPGPYVATKRDKSGAADLRRAGLDYAQIVPRKPKRQPQPTSVRAGRRRSPRA